MKSHRDYIVFSVDIPFEPSLVFLLFPIQIDQINKYKNHQDQDRIERHTNISTNNVSEAVVKVTQTLGIDKRLSSVL